MPHGGFLFFNHPDLNKKARLPTDFIDPDKIGGRRMEFLRRPPIDLPASGYDACRMPDAVVRHSRQRFSSSNFFMKAISASIPSIGMAL